LFLFHNNKIVSILTSSWELILRCRMLDIPESFQGQFPLPSSNPHATEGKRLLLYRQKPFGLIPVGWDQ